MTTLRTIRYFSGRMRFAVICLALLSMAATWEPQVPYTDQSQGDLHLRMHPESPTDCGIQVIEVGAQTGPDRFDAQFALLRDVFDSTYPGIAPEIRRAYSYNLPPKRGSDAPPLLLDIETAKAKLVTVFIYDIVKAVVAFTGYAPAEAASVAVDQYVQAYIQTTKYFRARALYTLQLMEESQNPDLTRFFSLDEVQRFLGVAREQSYKGLFLTKDFDWMADQSQDDARRLNRSTNFANLLYSLNREGLIAQPLFRDFVLVYYDPKKPGAHPIDTRDSDLGESPEDDLLNHRSLMTKDGLLPLGIYALEEKTDRLNTVDLEDTGQVADRRLIQKLDLLAKDTGSNFIPFPFSLTIYVANGGTSWVLNKKGKDLLADTLESEGELATLLDSGMVRLDPALVEEVRMQMTGQDRIEYRVNESNSAHNRQINAERMNTFLSTQHDAICSEIRNARETDFRSEYLTGGEALTREAWATWNRATGSSDESYNEDRARIIAERTPLVEARALLKTYDPNFKPYSSSELIHALTILGEGKNAEDAELIAEMIRYRVDTEVVIAAIQAAGANGAGNLAKPLLAYIDDFDLKANPVFHDGLPQAIDALAELDIAHATISPSFLFDKALRTLDRLRNSGVSDLAAKAEQAYLKLQSDSSVSQIYRGA